LTALGALHEDRFEYESASESFAEALRRDPLNEALRRKALRLLWKQQSWTETVQHLELPPPENQIEDDLSSAGCQLAFLKVFDSCIDQQELLPDAESIHDALLEAADLPHIRRPLFWETLHWRLKSAGQIRNSYLALDRSAESLIHRFSMRTTTTSTELALVFRALANLGRHEEIPELWRQAKKKSKAVAKSSYLEKVLADIAILTGDLEGFYSWHDHQAVTDELPPPTRKKIDELFRDRRLLIEGPAPDRQDYERFTAETDEVALRPNGLPDNSAFATATSDVYFLNAGLRQVGREVIEDASLRCGQVVLRRPVPWAFTSKAYLSGELRFVTTEPSLHFRGASFAIQRMIYEALTFRPLRIRVTGVDFFTGAKRHIDGYKKFADTDVSFEGFGHDYRGDLRLGRALHQAGAVEFDSLAVDVLSLSDDDYLAIVESNLEPTRSPE
jgi:tetratricopeptide (TPR) repeat protein